MAHKTCKICKETKPATTYYFYKCTPNADHLESYCKECKVKKMVNYQKTPKGRAILKRSLAANSDKWGAGVYEITNLITGDNYIGESITLQRRKYDHFTVCDTINNTNKTLQQDMKTYTPDAFVFNILESVKGDKTVLREREKYWIEKLKPTYNNYNKK